jgi:putative ABC transport system permease protein
MIKNYIKVAFRNIRKHKGYSAINILGLALGLACSLLVLLFVLEETGYDTCFENTDRIYRILTDDRVGEIMSAGTPFPMAPALQKDFPEIEKITRVRGMRGTVKKGDEYIQEYFICADEDVFDIFSLSVLLGNRENLLDDPNSVVISEQIAKKYFGADNPIGQVLSVDIRGVSFDLQVTGVFQDIPKKTTFKAGFITTSEVGKQYLRTFYRGTDIIPEEEWTATSYTTYLLLSEESNPELLEGKFPEFAKKYHDPENAVYSLQSIKDVYLHSSHLANNPVRGGNLKAIYLLILIGVAILTLAGINYIILTTAQAASRFNEIGVRKVVGAVRSQLIIQILSESVLTAILSLPLSVILMEVALPFINEFFRTRLNINFIEGWPFTLGAVVIIFIVGISSGAYIAFYQSSFRPIDILKNQLLIKRKKFNFRHAMIAVQLTIFIVLISCAGVVYSQINYAENQNPGFDRENLYLASSRDPDFPKTYRLFKNEVSGNPGIVSITGASMLPPDDGYAVMRMPMANDPEVEKLVEGISVDFDFVKTLGLELVQGRDFSRELDLPTSGGVIMNETAVKELGFESALDFVSKDSRAVGVAKDFHVHSFRHKIRSLMLFLRPEHVNEIAVRILPENQTETLAYLNEKWKEHFPDAYSGFMLFDDNLKYLYQEERRLGKIIGYASAIAVLISCLGLIGLSSFSSRQRTKEIGIRKICGASNRSVVRLLTREYFLLVVAAVFVSIPVTFYFMNRWLENYAYRTSIGWHVFVISGLGALIITLLTVSFQAFRAARANPVDSLRYE